MPANVDTSARIAHGRAGLHFQSALLPQGWVNDVRLVMEGGAFAHIESGVAPQAGDERAAVGVPGLPNLHSHAFQRALSGLAEHRGREPDSFWTWREVMYRFLAHMSPEDVEAISAQAYVEMLESGFTRVGEFHYLHHDPGGAPYADPAEMSRRIAAAAQRTGIALTLLPVFYAHGGFGGAAPSAGQRRFLCDVDGYARLVEASRAIAAQLADGRAGIAPHSLRAVMPEELAAILPLAGDSPIHIHAAEQVLEVEGCVAWSGKRPVEWLLDTGSVDARWCLVHATHMTPEETTRLAHTGAVAGLCPITEANLGDGYFPCVTFRDAGGMFGIGTDSNVTISGPFELRALEYGQRLQTRTRNVLGGVERSTGRALFEAAVRGGARALGAPAGIAVGAPADVVALDADHLVFAGRSGDQLLDAWIFSSGSPCVDRVFRGGEKVVSDGRHRERDAIGASYRKVLEKLSQAR